MSIAAPSALVASRKKAALEKLAVVFSLRELSALAERGAEFIHHPEFGPVIRKELGL